MSIVFKIFRFFSLWRFSSYTLFPIVMKTWLQSINKVPNRYVFIVVATDAQNRYLNLKHISHCSVLDCCSVAKSSPTLCIPVDCSIPGSPVHYVSWVCSNSCALSQCCCLTISLSAVLFCVILLRLRSINCYIYKKICIIFLV